MSRRLVVREWAQHDFRDAKRWYDNERRGLGAEFLAEVRSVLPLLRACPEMYPVVEPPFRRVVLDRFPYVLYFWEDEYRVQVIGCLHQRRDPGPLLYLRR